MATEFERALDASFIEKLVEAKSQGWWADVLKDPTLVIGLRGRYLNVYWRGQSLFNAEAVSSGLKVTTHEKFLIDPKLASQVRLTNGVFDIKQLVDKGFIRHYDSPTTLAEMKRAAGLFSGLEKTGCQEIAVNNSAVVDCEIVFPGTVILEDGHTKNGPRVDLVSLEADGDKEARLVFWEAKHFSNGELRADDDQTMPAVRTQIEFYRIYLSENRESIESSYTKVAKNLIAINKMGWRRPFSDLITDVAAGRRRLTLGSEPTIGLIIFGFDSAQRDHMGWKSSLEKLKKGFAPGRVLARGTARDIRLPID